MTVIWDKNIKELIWEVVSDKTNKIQYSFGKSVKMHLFTRKGS